MVVSPKTLNLSLFVGTFLILMNLGWAADTPRPKTKLNTQIYEKEDSNQTFNAVVKTVREMAGETQVLFDGKSGFYGLPDTPAAGKYQNWLILSQKKKLPVSVTVDPETRTIRSVEISGESDSSQDKSGTRNN